jgi:hypothetical protein
MQILVLAPKGAESASQSKIQLAEESHAEITSPNRRLPFGNRRRSRNRVKRGARPVTAIMMKEMMVPSGPGIEVYVRNKRPADMNAFRPERTLLYVHGATYPASTAFDLKLDGLSWMD